MAIKDYTRKPRNRKPLKLSEKSPDGMVKIKHTHEPSFAEKEIQKMFEIYKINIKCCYQGENVAASKRARAALNAMVPLIKIIRKEISEARSKWSSKDNQSSI